MVSLRLALVLALMVGSTVAPFATGHGRHTEGELFACDGADSGLFALVESVRPGTMPNGVCSYYVSDASGEFQLTSVDEAHPFVVGLADECPADWDKTDPNDIGDAWLLCNTVPDFDIKFTGGEYTNGPGDEAGTVGGGGAAVIVLFVGDEDSPLGPEAFVFHDRL